ncbi:MAG: glycosyltransferase [Steroidobacteraceae bacterium]
MLSVVQTVMSLDRESGGPAQVVPQLADALVDVGCAVSLVYVDSLRAGDAVVPAKAATAPAHALRIGGRALWSNDFARSIERSLPARGPRLIHDNGLWGYTNFIAASYAAKHGIPLVISPHGMLEPWALSYKARKKRIASALYQRRLLESAAMFVVSADSEAESVRRTGLKQPIAIVPAGVPLPETVAKHAPTKAQRRMLFMSRIHPKKGLAQFVDAWRVARQPGWKVVVAGPDEGGHQAEIQQLVSSHRLEADFEFPGPVAGEQKRRLFESADVFVLPTFSENFGVVIAEALSYGIPVLTTRGTPWAVLERINAGWWVEPDAAGIARGLRAALSTTVEERSSMGRSGRSLITRDFGWPMAGQKTYDAYAWLLGEQQVRPSHVHLS